MNIKLIISAILILAIIAAFTGTYHKGYTAGKAETEAAYLLSEHEAKEKIAELEKEKAQIVIEASRINDDKEKKIIELKRSQPKVKIHEIIKTMPCDNVGDGIYRMWELYRSTSLRINEL